MLLERLEALTDGKACLSTTVSYQLLGQSAVQIHPLYSSCLERNPVRMLEVESSLGCYSICELWGTGNAMATTPSSPPTTGSSLDDSLTPLPLPVSSSAALHFCVSRTGCCGSRRLFGRKFQDEFTRRRYGHSMCNPVVIRFSNSGIKARDATDLSLGNI